jgi:hypothetical protein
MLAIHLAWMISMLMDYVPSCFPYLEGCTSISRSARHGLANHLFRMIMYPAAVLQFFVWLIASQWLQEVNDTKKAGRLLPYIGLFAGICLCLYVTFLGTEGPIYRLLRKYGIALYYGLTYILQLIVHYRINEDKNDKLVTVMFYLCLALLPMGLASLYFSATFVDPLKDIAENIAEWNMTFIIMLWFLLLSFLWKKKELSLQFIHRRK